MRILEYYWFDNQDIANNNNKLMKDKMQTEEMEINDRIVQMEDSDDDDPIVDSFDLFINMPKATDQDELHLLQYPLRPHDRPYGDQGQLLKVEACFEDKQSESAEKSGTESTQ